MSSGCLMCTCVVHGFLYCHVCRLHCCALQCSTSVWRGFFSGLGWMTIYLSNTYGFIRRGIRAMLYTWYEELLLPDMIIVDAVIIHGSGPRGAGTTRALRQADVSLKMTNPQARSAGSTLAVHSPTRPARFPYLLTRSDPTRPARC